MPDDPPPSASAPTGGVKDDLQAPAGDPAAPSEPSITKAEVTTPEVAPPEITKAGVTATGSGAPPVKRPSFVFLGVVTLISLVADLGTKWWATSRLEGLHPNRRVELVKDYIGFKHATNPGGAWGLLQDESESIRKPFFLLISAAAIIFILSLYRRLSPEQRALKWGLPLVLGGALGNLVDRIRYGHVIDFIAIQIPKPSSWAYEWPTFNVADIAICVGVGLMAIDMFTSRKQDRTPTPAAKETASTAPDSTPAAKTDADGPAAKADAVPADADTAAAAAADTATAADTAAAADADAPAAADPAKTPSTPTPGAAPPPPAERA